MKLRDHHATEGNGELQGSETLSGGPIPDPDAPLRIKTELDALLDRVREDRLDTTGKNRLTVAFDCWRMFEDLSMRYKEECAMRDRYKRQSNSWRDKALRMAELLSEVAALDDGDEPFTYKHEDLFKRIHAEIES
jgi:hypothetical protein